jgi:hypothetical protein
MACRAHVPYGSRHNVAAEAAGIEGDQGNAAGSCTDLSEFVEQRRRSIALPMLPHEERTTRARENVRRAEEALRAGFGTRRAVERARSILADIEQNRDRS